MTSSDFFANKFEPHSYGNYGLYGLNTFGCDSIIKFNDEIWKFLHFKKSSEIPTFVNKNGDLIEINLRNAQNVTRMQICS